MAWFGLGGGKRPPREGGSNNPPRDERPRKNELRGDTYEVVMYSYYNARHKALLSLLNNTEKLSPEQWTLKVDAFITEVESATQEEIVAEVASSKTPKVEPEVARSQRRELMRQFIENLDKLKVRRAAGISSPSTIETFDQSYTEGVIEGSKLKGKNTVLITTKDAGTIAGFLKSQGIPFQIYEILEGTYPGEGFLVLPHNVRPGDIFDANVKLKEEGKTPVFTDGWWPIGCSDTTKLQQIKTN